MDTITALAVLDDALNRCRKEDVRTPDVFAALDFLEARAAQKWPFDQFRRGLENRDTLYRCQYRSLTRVVCGTNWHGRAIPPGASIGPLVPRFPMLRFGIHRAWLYGYEGTMPKKQNQCKDEEVPQCRCGAKLSSLNGQCVCIPCIEANSASDQTVANFARALMVQPASTEPRRITPQKS